MTSKNPRAEPRGYRRREGEPIETGCKHPEAKRIDVRAMGKPDRWICGECGHKHGFEGED